MRHSNGSPGPAGFLAELCTKSQPRPQSFLSPPAPSLGAHREKRLSFVRGVSRCCRVGESTEDTTRERDDERGRIRDNRPEWRRKTRERERGGEGRVSERRETVGILITLGSRLRASPQQPRHSSLAVIPQQKRNPHARPAAYPACSRNPRGVAHALKFNGGEPHRRRPPRRRIRSLGSTLMLP